MTAALIGFLGVIVGAAITGGVSYVLERRKEARELRTAARVLVFRFSACATELDIARNADPGDTLCLQTQDVREPRWESLELTFAGALNTREYFVVDEGINVIWSMCALAQRANGDPTAVHLETLVELREKIELPNLYLSALAADEDPLHIRLWSRVRRAESLLDYTRRLAQPDLERIRAERLALRVPAAAQTRD